MLPWAQQSPSPSPQPIPAPSLSLPQRQEVRKLIRDEVENSGAIRDRVQEDVNRTFGWTTTLLNIQMVIVTLLPIAISVVFWRLQGSIQKQIVDQAKVQVAEEVESQFARGRYRQR